MTFDKIIIELASPNYVFLLIQAALACFFTVKIRDLLRLYTEDAGIHLPF